MDGLGEEESLWGEGGGGVYMSHPSWIPWGGGVYSN